MRIVTNRLVLRRWNADDAPALHALITDLRVAEWLGSADLTLADVPPWIETNELSFDERGYGRFAVVDRETGELVGRVGMAYAEQWHGTPEKEEIGWVIHPDRWGEGLATEAAAAVIADTFRRVGLERIVSFTMPTNIASRRVMEKLGFAFERDIVHRGLPHLLYRRRAGAVAAGPAT